MNSTFEINEEVMVEISEGTSVRGTVIGVDFTEEKVFYRVNLGKVIARVDSALVYKC